MRPVTTILGKLFIRRFYEQHAGLFLFIFTVMVAIVESIRGDKYPILVYHYHLISGILVSNQMLGAVLFLWIIYGLQCSRFVLHTLSSTDNSFLYVLNGLSQEKRVILLLSIQVILYLPVFGYAVIIIVIAIIKRLYLKAALIFCFNLLLCLVSACGYLEKLRYPGTSSFFIFRYQPLLNVPKPYFSFLLSHLFTRLPFLYTGIKIYCCIILYAFLRNLTPEDYDLRLMMLMFSMGLVGHGVIIHKTRSMEEIQLAFYRQLPVARWKRWMQYVVFYFLLLVPETIVIAHRTPLYLDATDAVNILLFALSFLLLMHAFLSASLMPLKQFLKISFTMFMLSYFFIIANAYMPLIALLLISATTIFINRYYKFELS